MSKKKYVSLSDHVKKIVGLSDHVKIKGDLSDNVEVGVSLFDAIEFPFQCFLGGFICFLIAVWYVIDPALRGCDCL